MAESDRVARERASGFFSLPSTSIGAWSAGLLLLSFLLIVLNVFLVLPMTERRAGLELVQTVYSGVTFLCVASAGVTGLIALLRKRERSWVVVVSVVVLIVLLGFVAADFVVPE